MRHSNDLRFEGVVGGWANDLRIFLGNGKLSVRHNEVEQEDEGRQSIALDIVLESTDLLRRVVVLVEVR